MTDRLCQPYHLVRSDRRTLSLSLDRRGELTARAPRRMPVSEIERFIEQKSGWLQKKRDQLARRAADAASYSLKPDACLPYLGKEVRVEFASVARPVLCDGVLTLPRRGDALTHALRWLAQSAEAYLPPRVRLWAERMRVDPASVAFGHAKRRWGSMTGAGAMRLNIALMLCAPELIDYVIVHELAHRVHPNHSAAFHAYVQSVLPDAAARREGLKAVAVNLELLRPDAKEERE